MPARLSFALAAATLLLAASASAQPADAPAAGVCSVGTCQDSTGTMQYADGTRYEGRWQNGLREGVGVLVHPEEGWSWAGKWHGGAATPAGDYRFADGTTIYGPLPSGLAGVAVDPWTASGLTPPPPGRFTLAAEIAYGTAGSGTAPTSEAPPVDVADRLARPAPAPAPPTFERRPDGSVVERLTDGNFRVVYSDGTRMTCSAVDMCDRTYQHQQETFRRLGVE